MLEDADMPVSPLQASQDVLDRARQLLTLDPGSESVSLLQYDVRRQAIVMGVAALDTWMHWSIRSVSFDSLSPKLAGLEIGFGDLVGMGQASLSARRTGKNDRPAVRARNVLNERILKMTFQSAKQWEDGFALLGIKKGLTRTGAAMPVPQTHDAVSKRLNELSHRRNKIVHEGDLRRLVRPQKIVRSQLLRQAVDADLDWIGDFLVAADSVT